jgi:hypothetical protein
MPKPAADSIWSPVLLLMIVPAGLECVCCATSASMDGTPAPPLETCLLSSQRFQWHILSPLETAMCLIVAGLNRNFAQITPYRPFPKHRR